MRVYIKSIRPEGVTLSCRDYDAGMDRYLLRDLWQPAEVLAEFELVDGNFDDPRPLTAWERMENLTKGDG